MDSWRNVVQEQLRSSLEGLEEVPLKLKSMQLVFPLAVLPILAQ